MTEVKLGYSKST